jgi:hypothetical protein
VIVAPLVLDFAEHQPSFRFGLRRFELQLHAQKRFPPMPPRSVAVGSLANRELLEGSGCRAVVGFIIRSWHGTLSAPLATPQAAEIAFRPNRQWILALILRQSLSLSLSLLYDLLHLRLHSHTLQILHLLHLIYGYGR